MTKKMLCTLGAAAVCGALLIAGCKVSHQDNSENAKVSVEGPGASVKVDTQTTANDSGLPLYPGAREKHSSGDDKGRAHVDLDMPFLKVKVVAMKFTSDDAPEKILAFYRDKLGSYGKVLECKGGSGQDVELGSKRGMDTPVTCSKLNGNSGEISLKVGTEGNQHAVSVKPSSKGSEFALVYVHLSKSKSDDDYGGKPSS